MIDKFEFINTEIDKIYLEEMYDNDKDILLSVFEEFVSSYGEVVHDFEKIFLNDNLLEIQYYIHKHKPIFGYIGFTGLAHSLQHFSNKCSFYKDIKEAEKDFNVLFDRIKETKEIIKIEILNLKKIK
jgi:hypothetical protein